MSALASVDSFVQLKSHNSELAEQNDKLRNLQRRLSTHRGPARLVSLPLRSRTAPEEDIYLLPTGRTISMPSSRRVPIASSKPGAQAAASPAQPGGLQARRTLSLSEDDAAWLSTDAALVPGQRPPRVTTSELAQLYAELGTLEKNFVMLPKSISFSRKETFSKKDSGVPGA